jgi:hypothetical protein
VTPDLPNVEIAIIEMTNDFRRQHRLTELRRSRTLDAAARRFATYLARSGKFSHTADGRRPHDRTTAAGYRHCRILENLALNLDSRGFRTRQLALGAVEGWKKSPPHRKAMIDPLVTEIGVGVVKAPGEQRYLSVQLFGRPLALQYRFTIRNLATKRVAYSQSGRQHELPPRTEIQYTPCDPVRLRFEHVQQASRRRGAAEFAPRDGDVFVVRSSRPGTGKLVVEHHPRVN